MPFIVILICSKLSQKFIINYFANGFINQIKYSEQRNCV